jgi:uncharacterized protein
VQQSVQSFHFTQQDLRRRIGSMLLLLSISVLATAFLSGVFGMAGGMALMGILLALLSVEQAMVVHGIAQFAANGWRAAIWWRHVHWRVFRGYALGAALVVAAMLVLQPALSRPIVLIVLGVTPFIVFVLPRRLSLNVDRPGQPLGCGVACMGVQMLAGVSGPLLDAFFVRSAMSRHEVVSTKAAVQTLSHASRIAFFGTLLASAERPLDVGWVLMLVASAVIGTSASRLVLDRISDGHFRSVTRHLVLTMGGCYLVAGFWLLR